MQIIIAQGNRKRKIEGPFGICASREDMENLRAQISEWLEDPGNGCGISYGWLFVQPPPTYHFGPPDTAPEPWDS